MGEIRVKKCVSCVLEWNERIDESHSYSIRQELYKSGTSLSKSQTAHGRGWKEAGFNNVFL